MAEITYKKEDETGIQRIPVNPPRPIPTNTPEEFDKRSQTPNNPYGSAKAKNTSGPVGSPFAISSDWRISKNAEGVASHLAPNAQLPEGHTLVPNSNSPNINRAIINFRLNNQKNPAPAPATPATPAAGAAPTPAAPTPAAPTPTPAGAAPAVAAADKKKKADEKKKPWWSNLQGSALDLPTRLGVSDANGKKPAPAGGGWVGPSNYNALNRKFGDAQRSFTDIQKEAYPNGGGGKDNANEIALHQADLLKRGETESVTVIGPNGVATDKVFKRSPQFEEDQTMSTAKENRAMARSKKWSQSDSAQKQWRARYFRGK